MASAALMAVGMEGGSSWELFNSIREKSAERCAPKLSSRRFWSTDLGEVNDKNLIVFYEGFTRCLHSLLLSVPPEISSFLAVPFGAAGNPLFVPLQPGFLPSSVLPSVTTAGP